MNKLDFWAMVCRKPEGEGAAEGGPVPDFSAFADILGSGEAAPKASPAEKGAGEDSGGTGAGVTPATAAPAPAPGEGSASQPTPPAEPPEVPQPGPAQTEGQTDPQADLQRQVAEFLAKAQPKAVQEAETTPSPPPAEIPQSPAEPAGYNFQVPDQMVEALGSDDPALRKAALTGLVNGLAARLSQDFSKALAELANYVKTQVPEEVIGQVEQRQTFEGMKKDLYQTFPQIRQLAAMPGVEGAIWQQIRAVGTQMGQKDWTPEFRDGVGRMILLNAGLPVQAAPQPQQPAPAQPAPQRSPRAASFSAGGQGGSRSNGAGGQANEFMELLNAGSG